MNSWVNMKRSLGMTRSKYIENFSVMVTVEMIISSDSSYIFTVNQKISLFSEISQLNGYFSNFLIKTHFYKLPFFGMMKTIVETLEMRMENQNEKAFSPAKDGD